MTSADTWTKTAPTEAGYYWYRLDRFASGPISDRIDRYEDKYLPSMAEIYDARDGTFRVDIYLFPGDPFPTVEEATHEGYWSAQLIPPPIPDEVPR